ncbi:LysR family transcriptional regulator [Georhizobium profundi]|jgi:DNA-binding transcriptional LysR family regulator|uniref:LysR family transcriptional regulator n=1 Tax=Georhizobium profundi TaxID=2341112 RepID=A0A3Q8XPK6_9HYPH|nr:LysR family transcriptional regulator [Georhizobium profundi]AZN71189.1 LysR family transcriptional regulator [Georhizobium profundi]
MVAPLDWDKLRIFHAAAEAGSFTHAADALHLSQSAISRQVSALEHEVGTKLFHRHARGLILTEQGEMLYHTAHDVLLKLETVRARLTETSNKPSGKLRVTTTVGLGQGWLTEKVQEFLELYPEMQLQLILDNEELDVNMRHADCAIRLRQPQQPDLIQRKLFTVHLHVYASPNYINRFGEPKSPQDLDGHRIITFGEPAPGYLLGLNSLEVAGRTADNPRVPHLQINNLTSVKRAVQMGIGIAMLPDYMVGRDSGLVQLETTADAPSFDTYFCYPEEIKNAAKLKAFRDFLISKARNWNY